MLGLGDTVMLPKPGGEKEHLWALITAPDLQSGEAIMVNLTTQRPHSDTTTIIQPGEHPFVDRPTVVFYADARIVDVNNLDAALRQGVAHHMLLSRPTSFSGFRRTYLNQPLLQKKSKRHSRSHSKKDSPERNRAHSRMLLRNPARITHRGQKLWAHGNAELLKEPLYALLCSKACPGEKIIEAIDLAQRWRAESRPVISGFHTPVERECLRIFLRGLQRIVISPARGLGSFLLPVEWQQKFSRGELLIISSFDSSIRRPTKETAEVRTRLVLSLAQAKTIIHASPGGFLSRLLEESRINI